MSKYFVEIKNYFENFNRISLTLDFIKKSENIIFIISGSKKAIALKECLFGKYQPDLYPAQYIFKNYQKRIIILCDRPSYSLIE